MTSTQRPPSVRPVDYKGEPLDAERGPGLGCFWTQLTALVVLVVLTPLTVTWGWPSAVSIGLLFATIILLLFAGQTVIFLLRLVAADRREGRRVPMSGSTPTVGELEDTMPPDAGPTAGAGAPGRPDAPGPTGEPPALAPDALDPAGEPPAGHLPRDAGVRE